MSSDPAATIMVAYEVLTESRNIFIAVAQMARFQSNYYYVLDAHALKLCCARDTGRLR